MATGQVGCRAGRRCSTARPSTAWRETDRFFCLSSTCAPLAMPNLFTCACMASFCSCIPAQQTWGRNKQFAMRVCYFGVPASVGRVEFADMHEEGKGQHWLVGCGWLHAAALIQLLPRAVGGAFRICCGN